MTRKKPPQDDEGPMLTPQQAAALEALLAGASHAVSAETADKSVRWLWNQLNRAGAFKTAYERACRALQRDVEMSALRRSRDVLAVVEKIALDPEHDRCLQAAQILLSLHRKAKS